MDNYKNVYEYLRINYEYYQINFNLSLYLNYLFEKFSKKSLKNKFTNLQKITLNLSSILKIYKFAYKQSFEYSIIDHLRHFNNLEVNLKNLKKNRSYFIEKEDKYFNIKILDINKDKIKIYDNKIIDFNDYKFMIYPRNFDMVLNKIDLFNFILFKDFFYKIYKIYFDKNDINNNKLLSYFTSDIYIKENLYFLKDIEFEEIEEDFKFIKEDDGDIVLFCKLDINSNDFKKLLNNFSKGDKINIILFKLFDLYNFPFKYNKREFDPIFEKILYFSFLNYTKFIGIHDDKISLHPIILNNIPIKLRTLYYNIMKIYYEFVELKSFNNLIFNPKIYNDQIHYEVIKIIFEFDNLINKIFFLDEINYNKIVKTIKEIIILTKLSKKIKWKNL